MTQCAHGEFLNRTADVHLGAVLTLSVLVPHAAMHPCSSWWRKAAGLHVPSTHTHLYLQAAHTHRSISRQHTHSAPLFAAAVICSGLDWESSVLMEWLISTLAVWLLSHLLRMPSSQSLPSPGQHKKKNQISSCHSLKIRNVLSLHSAKQPLPLPESSQEQVQGP